MSSWRVAWNTAVRSSEIRTYAGLVLGSTLFIGFDDVLDEFGVGVGDVHDVGIAGIVSEAVDHGRAATGGQVHGLAGLAGPDDPAYDHDRYETLKQLDAALAQLSDEHRIVVLLHDTEGYKLSEIQELTGIAVGTIKSRLHRARARLREILTASGTLS